MSITANNAQLSKFRQVYQPTSYACMAAVAAMITGDCIDEVFDFIGHECRDRHVRFLEVAAYLNSRGFHLGSYASPFPLVKTMRRILGRPIRGVQWYEGQAALVIVASRGDGCTHAVLWTGNSVLDPEPANQGCTLNNYTVLEWWPLIRFEG